MEEKKDEKGKGALFIPSGLFIGMGIGFILNNVTAGIFIGLGCGFVAFTISLFLINK